MQLHYSNITSEGLQDAFKNGSTGAPPPQPPAPGAPPKPKTKQSTMAQQPATAGAPPANMAPTQAMQQTQVTPNVPQLPPQQQQSGTAGQGVGSAQDMWNQIQQNFGQGLNDQYRLADMEAARMGRRGHETAAMQSGGGYGGLAAAAGAQAGLAGQEMKMQALGDNQKRQAEAEMAWLNMMKNSEEAQKNRDLQSFLQAKQQELQARLAAYSMDLTPNMVVGNQS